MERWVCGVGASVQRKTGRFGGGAVGTGLDVPRGPEACGCKLQRGLCRASDGRSWVQREMGGSYS